MDAGKVLVIEDDDSGTTVVGAESVATLSEWAYANSSCATFGAELRDDLELVAALPDGLRAAGFAAIARWVARRFTRYEYVDRSNAGRELLLPEEIAVVTATVREFVAGGEARSAEFAAAVDVDESARRWFASIV
jgi:hypothetical protein